MAKKELNGFQKVLVRNTEKGFWCRQIFDYYDAEAENKYVCLGGLSYKYCIPYKGNEKLANTFDNCEEEYIPNDGDFIVSGTENCEWIAIVKGEYKKSFYQTYAGVYEKLSRKPTHFSRGMNAIL